MQSKKDEHKCLRFRNFIVKSMEIESLNPDFEDSLAIIFENNMTQNYEQLRKSLKDRSEIWQKIKHLTKKFEGLESTRFSDVESDENESLKESKPGKFESPAKNESIRETKVAVSKGLTNLTVSNNTFGLEGFQALELASEMNVNFSDSENEKIGSVLNLNFIRQSLILYQNLQEEFISEIISDFESGFVLYMKSLLDSLILIGQKTKAFDENSFKFVDAESRQAHPFSFVLANDPIDKFKNSEKRELKIQEFYENKIKNNREKEENNLKDKQVLPIGGLLVDKTKSKGFNEVYLKGTGNSEHPRQNQTPKNERK